MQAPKLPSFIKQNRHKNFEFKPRYYDERKERIQELRKKYGQETGARPTGGEHLRGKLSNHWQESRGAKVQKSNRTLILIIAILLFITYYIIKL